MNKGKYLCRMSGVEHQYSDTAEVAASYRAVACKEYPETAIGADYLAEYFISTSHKFLAKFGFVRKLGIAKSRKFTPGGFEYVLARTAFFDRQLLSALETGAKQLVILGAGFDTRAYRFAEQCSGCKIIELDIASTQNRKKECLQSAGIAIPKNLTFASINFNLESLPDVLRQAGYNNEVKTVFLWEGVSMYLQRPAVEATLQFVGACKNPESLLVFDYIATIADSEVDNYYGVKTWRETWARYRQAEPFKFTIDDSQIASYLEGMGLSIQTHLKEREIGEHCLPKPGYKNLGRVTGWFRFVTASPIC